MGNPAPDPSLNRVNLFALYTYETLLNNPTPACRVYVDSDHDALQAYGERLHASKPAEVSTFGFMVLEVEGIR